MPWCLLGVSAGTVPIQAVPRSSIACGLDGIRDGISSYADLPDDIPDRMIKVLFRSKDPGPEATRHGYRLRYRVRYLEIG